MKVAAQTFRSQKLDSLKAELNSILPTSFFHVFFLCFSGFVGLYSYRPMKELDFFWRIMLGDSLISNGDIEVDNLATWGNFDVDWRTTQPLGEIVLSVIYRLGGLELISASRIVVWFFVVWMVYRLLLNQNWFQEVNAYTQLTLTIYGLTCVYLLLPFIQERPQTILLIFLTITAPNLVETLMNSKASIRVSTWLILSISVFIHPAWLVIYVFIFFHIVRNVFQHQKNGLKECTLLLLVPALPLFGPSGVNYYLNLIEISRLGRSYISEWQPLWKMDLSQPVLLFFFCQFLLVLILAIELARRLSPKKSLVFIVLLIALQIFAVLAVRDLPIAIILSIALFSVVLNLHQSETFEFNKHNLQTTFQKFSSIEKIPTCLRLIPIVFLILTLASSVFQSLRASEDFSKIAPLVILQSMKDLGSAKVVNSSNEGGYIHYFAGASAQPFIDGRIDRYTRDQLNLLDKLFSSESGSKELRSAELEDATEILVQRENPLRPEAESGFRFICQENGYLWFSRQSAAICERNE